MEHDSSYLMFGAEAILKRLQALSQEVEGVRQSQDIEFVHRMRVASRRTRSALALFGDCLPRKKLPGWEKAIRRITRALGAARDTDVQLAFLQETLDCVPDPAYEPGIARLMLRLRQRRTGLQEQVLETLGQLEEKRVLDEMGHALRQHLVRARLDGVSPRSEYLYRQSAATILLLLEELLAYDPYVRQPGNVEELHAMRIEAKRLRYTVEIFAPLYEGGLKPQLQALRATQDAAGEIHDCDVWVAYLPQFIEEERARTLDYLGHTRPFKRLTAGLIYLQEERRERRRKCYEELVRVWDQSQEDGAWQALRETLNGPPSSPSEPDEPAPEEEHPHEPG